MYDNESKNVGLSFLVGVTVGALVGSIAALLLAPKSGSETREDLKNASADLKEKADNFVQIVSEKSKEIMDTAKNKIGQVAETLKKSEACESKEDETV